MTRFHFCLALALFFAPSVAVAVPAANVDSDAVVDFIRESRLERLARIKQAYESRQKLRTNRVIGRVEQRKRIATVNELIVELSTPTRPYYAEEFPRFNLRVKYQQIVGPLDALVISRGESYWLHGLSTEGLSDGSQTVVEFVVTTGTKQYTTVLGAAKTVAILEPRNIHAVHDEFTRRRDMREWITKDGRKTTGVVLFYDSGRVTLVDMELEETQIKLSLLSDVDRDYLTRTIAAPKRPGR